MRTDSSHCLLIIAHRTHRKASDSKLLQIDLSEHQGILGIRIPMASIQGSLAPYVLHILLALRSVSTIVRSDLMVISLFTK